MDILRIKEKVDKEVILEDGMYYGIWGGNVIEFCYKHKEYEIITEEGVRGIGIKVVIIVKDGKINFEMLKNLTP